MKIALFSDVHGNLPALEAFFAGVETRQPDALYCLGDLAVYNIWSNEVIHEIRKRNMPTIAENYDFGIGRTSDDCGCAYKTDDEKPMQPFQFHLPMSKSEKKSEFTYIIFPPTLR